MVRRMAAEIPPEYLEGIAAIEVSPKTVPHPLRAHVYTLGECVPIHGDGHEIASRVLLYHGSFQALAAERDDFDWRTETWDTLVHELRHHLEWKAQSGALEAYDWAAEQNFARQEGRSFDPLFYEAGERIAEGVYRVDDDVFFERVVGRWPAWAEMEWHGRAYAVSVPEVPPPLYLLLDGLEPEPAGDVALVLRRRPRIRDLFRASQVVTERRADVEPLT